MFFIRRFTKDRAQRRQRLAHQHILLPLEKLNPSGVPSPA